MRTHTRSARGNDRAEEEEEEEEAEEAEEEGGSGRWGRQSAVEVEEEEEKEEDVVEDDAVAVTTSKLSVTPFFDVVNIPACNDFCNDTTCCNDLGLNTRNLPFTPVTTTACCVTDIERPTPNLISTHFFNSHIGVTDMPPAPAVVDAAAGDEEEEDEASA